ncbi:MAG: hypothetical protein KDE56_12315 [Anaerolineales bacterium]|nr:hypothetical protein [Anaerolineales bacterium]MCB9432508.1 hypothetical protein [Ardenticatenaceae bacterium]
MPQLHNLPETQKNLTNMPASLTPKEQPSVFAPPPWPWTKERWNKKIEGVHEAIRETIDYVTHTINARNNAIDEKKGLKAEGVAKVANNRMKLTLELTELLTELASLGPKPRSPLDRKKKWSENRISEIEKLLGNDLDILQESMRQNELSKTIFELDNQTARLNDCEKVLESLKDNVLSLFEKILSNEIKNELQKYSPDYVFRLFLEQVSIDINLIHQALQQRQLNKDDEITQQGFVLQMAHIIGMNAVLPAINDKGGFTEDTNIICYLRNGVDIRLIPYQNVMLIGVPYGVLCHNSQWVPTDYLALPHEIGHYLFWFRQEPTKEILKENLEEKLRTQFGEDFESSWQFHWLEEIVADAFGCRIAGPISVLGFQELLASSPPTAREALDHVHPTPELRPFIQSELLHKMGQINAEQKEKLDQNWISWVKENWLKEKTANPMDEHPFQLHGQNPNSKLTGKEILESLDPVLEIVADQIMALIPENEHRNWSHDWGNNEPMSVETLYNNFTSGGFLERFKPLEAVKPDAPRPVHRFDPSQTKLDKLDDKWVEDMLFKGWSKEGPEGSNLGT